MEDFGILVAETLLSIKAVKLSPQKPFTWASGLKSPIYCDNRVTLSYPISRKLITAGLKKIAAEFGDVDYIAGVATAGIAHGALLADVLEKPYIYVRDKAKSHGRQNQIEGFLQSGSKVLVVEDLISTGGSSIKAVDVIRKAECKVAGVIAIFSYNFKNAEDNFAKAECKYATISDYRTLLPLAVEKNYITKEEKSLLDDWNNDQKSWSDKFNQSKLS